MRAPANSNTNSSGHQMDPLILAEPVRLHAEDARRFYAEETPSDVECFLRGSSDLATTFAEPGEMDHRLKAETELEEAYSFRALIIAVIACEIFLAAILGVAFALRGS